MNFIFATADAHAPRLLAALLGVVLVFSSVLANDGIAAVIGGKSAPGDALRGDDTDSDPILSELKKKEYDKALQAAKQRTQSSPQDPEGFNLLGGAYIGKNDLANARKSYEAALRVAPGYVPAMLNLAQLDLRQNDPGSAAKRYRAVLAKDPGNAAAMEGMASVEAAAGNDKEVLGWLERVRERHPRDLAPVMSLAHYYYARKDYLSALAVLNSGPPEYADNADRLELLGQVQLAAGRHPESLKTFSRLVAVRPSSALSRFELASAQAVTHDTQGAITSLKKALELKADFVEAAVALANVYVANNRASDALNVASQLQTAAPNSANGYVLQGDILMSQKRYRDAANAYGKAFSLKQTGFLASKVHAARSLAGDTAAADAELQRWMQNHPIDFRVRRYLASEYARRGNTKLAIDQYEMVIRADPKDLAALNNLAILYQDEKKNARALELAEAAYKLQPQSAAAADTLGWILIEQGERSRGMELLRRAVGLEPNNSQLRYHWAAALAKSGDNDQARSELEKLLSTKEDFPQRQAAETLLKQL